MKRLAALFLMIGLCALALITSRTHAQRPDTLPGKGQPEASSEGKLRRNKAAIKNQYIVVFNESVGRKQVGKEAESLARMHGGTIGFTYQNALRGFSVEMNEAQAEALSRNPKVEFVEEDAEVQGASTQTNPLWPLDRLDQRNPTPSNSYTYESDGTGVNAYVIDGGIRYKHEQFGNRAAFAYDYVVGGTGADCNGHGTHAAALIGGNTYGVAKGVKLWSVRVFDCANGGSIARVVSGVDWVAGNHVKPAVANLSFITVASTSLNGTLDIAVKNLIAAGVTTVVAAGNNTGDASLRTPSRVPEAITVAATDQYDNRAPFSNFGSVVDVFAPGVDIVSAWASGDTATQIRSGTSSAAPLVAGLAARYLATRPGDQPDAVSQAIRNSATPGIVVDPGAGSPNLLAYTGITLSDDFNDNVRDVAKWNVLATSGSNIAEQNGRLEVTPTAAMPNYDGYISNTAVDLSDSRISVEAVAVPTTNGFATFYALRDQSGNYLLLGRSSDGFLLMQRSAGGVLTQETAPYNATQQRFWRFRHNRADDKVNWETSPDGVTWTTHSSMSVPFPITNLQVALAGQKSTAAAPAQTVIFDNLWHEPNPTPPVVYADNFDDNVINPLMWDAPDPVSPTTVSEQNGRIEIALQPNTAGYNALYLAGNIDLRDKTLQVEVQPASQAGWVETYLLLYHSSGNYFALNASNNLLASNVWVNGVRDYSVVNWNQHSFWRLRHDADANTVNFESSPDGVTWTTLKTVVAPFPLDSLKASLVSGAWGTGNAAPGTAVYDNFRLERYRPLFPQSDDFNDNVRDAKKWSIPATTDFTFAEQNGRLEITPGAAANHESYTSVATLDLTDARISVECVYAPVYSGSGTYLLLGDPSTNNYMLIGLGGGTFVLQEIVNGVSAWTLVPYDATKHRFWRIRHNRANDTLNWESSADNVTWTTHRTSPRPFSITNLPVNLMAGKNATNIPSMTTIFDNLRIERNEGGKTR
jgi:subtilisin family serine protease/regulation of enolase protein 1 (concanavalin A-like superfamily)